MNKKNVVVDENYDIKWMADHFKSHSNWSMPFTHRHNVHELYFFISGDTRYIIGKEFYDISDGELVIIPKDIAHRTISKVDSPCERKLIYFDDSMLSAVKAQIPGSKLDGIFSPCTIKFPKKLISRLNQLFSLIIDEQIHPDDLSDAFVLSLLSEIFILALRHGRIQKGFSGDSAEDKISTATLYMAHNYNHNITLTSVAAEVYMERTYFSRMFAKVTGKNFNAYLTELRLERAQQLLIESPFSIDLIAEDCGFSSGKYLWSVFKKHKGMSPTQFRRMSR